MQSAGTVDVAVKPAADPCHLLEANGFAVVVVDLAAEVVAVASGVFVVAAVDSTLHIYHQPLPHEPEQEVGHSDCTLPVHLKLPQQYSFALVDFHGTHKKYVVVEVQSLVTAVPAAVQ